MNEYSQLIKHPDISLSPISDSIGIGNPATGEILAYVRNTGSDKLKNLIQKAAAAQKLWAAKTALERADILWRWYFLVKENKEALARLMTMEQGKSLTEARGEIDYAASFVRWFAEEARRIDGDVLTSVKASQKLVVLKQPVGVTAAITPWNFPSAMIARKAAPALAVGCAMIVKPASLTPLSAYALASLAYEAGIPQDLLPVVSGSASEIGHEFATNPIIRKISFTGSTEVGAKIFADSAADIKKLSLELGGNAPFIVFDDADLDKAVEGALASKFRNSGQTCVCTNRVYAQSAIYDEFCRKLSEKAAALKLGNGLEDGVNQGPLCPVFRFETEAEVIEAANNTEYGLAAYLFTADTARQWRVGEALEYGMVGINTGLISNEAAPFGGVKRSGLGREGSKYGADEYLELKYLCMDVG
nr:NAD-dependent succinate-semialdehyde dehydrogenase [Neisseria meningitidis]